MRCVVGVIVTYGVGLEVGDAVLNVGDGVVYAIGAGVGGGVKISGGGARGAVM
jgi:hypothetical protein